MATSNTSQPIGAWALQSTPHNGFGSSGFTQVKQLRVDVDLVRSVSNQRLYVCKTLKAVGEDEDGFKYSIPPELRVSTFPRATVQLPNEDYFPKLVGWQQWTATKWQLYTEYYNGGNLKSFILEHFDYFDEQSGQAARRNVPEHFIWHVAEQIGEALVYIHLGRPRGTSGPGACTPLPGWVPVYHRDISDSNIFLNYPTTANSELGTHRARAFPQVVLGDWGEAAVQGDHPDQLQGGTPPASSISPDLREWTDVHQFGRVLRLLCMAHVDLDTYSTDGEDDEEESGIEDDEEESWELDRPDSQTVENCNEYGAAKVYSDELIQLLQMFERPDMDTTSIVDQIQYVPTVTWIASHFLPLVRSRVQQFRDPPIQTVDYYRSLDVSWTKPDNPVP